MSSATDISRIYYAIKSYHGTGKLVHEGEARLRQPYFHEKVTHFLIIK